jgi:hypothetical protein
MSGRSSVRSRQRRSKRRAPLPPKPSPTSPLSPRVSATPAGPPRCRTLTLKGCPTAPSLLSEAAPPPHCRSASQPRVYERIVSSQPRVYERAISTIRARLTTRSSSAPPPVRPLRRRLPHAVVPPHSLPSAAAPTPLCCRSPLFRLPHRSSSSSQQEVVELPQPCRRPAKPCCR